MKAARSHRCAALVCAGLLAGIFGPSVARAAGDAGARAHLAQERRDIESLHADRQRQCATQFVVTSCVEAARAQHREALLALDAREASLDDAERRQRALDRQARIDAKVARQAEAASEREPMALVPAERVSRVRPALAPHGAAEPQAARADRPSAEELKAREVDSRGRFEQREREALARRNAAAARQRGRELSGKPAAAPLPALAASDTGVR